jgi:hypothetical protein
VGPPIVKKPLIFEVSGFFHMTVRKLWVGQKRVKVVPQKNNSFSRDLSIQDGRGNILAIQIRNFGLDVDRSFDCVTLSARYDYGSDLAFPRFIKKYKSGNLTSK